MVSKSPNAQIAPRTHAQVDAEQTAEVAAPFVTVIDSLPVAIPERERTAIVMAACGFSCRLVAQEIGVTPQTILAWNAKHRAHISSMRQVVTRIATDLIGGLVGDLVMTGLAVVPSLHARAKSGALEARDVLLLSQAARNLAELAKVISESPQPRHDRRLSATRADAEAAINAITPQ